ncbi:MAG: acetyl/propionyl/methylcrotonyl-CoA carboxylase subunit alpha [Pseudomonadota bacterium]
MIKKLLIANRGEIACRIMETARRLGVRTVAVYSDADARAKHVELADEAVRLGPAPVTESYLVTDKVIAAATAVGATAVHPGYGFLSENASFAAACEDAGITFVGPPSAAISAMGSKSEAKKIMAAADVPLIPGYHGDDQSDTRLQAEADAMGYPVLIKASAGGGGRGMRIVEEAGHFEKELAAARREASGAFGDDHVLLEKYLGAPRHIEVQIFADTHGNTVHLFERDCSIQRRHQKVIEEAPAPNIDPETRARICDSAMAAARGIGYVGAGTVEFLLDTDGRHYFMEMNTRLQVEHPVTEMITGFDLVEWQLRVANQEPLPASQEAIAIHGHAVEARLYAENPDRNFMPSTGVISHLRYPDPHPAVRVDTGVRSGDEVSFYYDPMVAKIIAWGDDRRDASLRLADALDETEVLGIITNATYLADLCRYDAFLDAQLHTGFLAEHATQFRREADIDPTLALSVAAYFIVNQRAAARRLAAQRSADPYSPWHATNAWRLSRPGSIRLRLSVNDEQYDVSLRVGEVMCEVTIANSSITIGGRAAGDNQWELTVDGVNRRYTVLEDEQTVIVFTREGRVDVLNLDQLGEDDDSATSGGKLLAPLPGKVISVAVEPGQAVSRGATLLVLEAMKMEHNIVAPTAGTVAEIRYAVGDLVDEDAELIVLTTD